MQAPATGKSLAESQSFNREAKGHHTFRHAKGVDDDGSTSAGSSDRENDGISSVSVSEPGRTDEPGSSALVYLLDMLSVTPEPKQSSKTRPPKSMRKLQKSQRQQINKNPSVPPGLRAIAPPPGLQQMQDIAVPFRFTPPPGLPPPCDISLPPGLEFCSTKISNLPESFEPYNPKVFHRELVAILRELSQNTNVAAAVRRVRSQTVPTAQQAAETTDILTRAAEECRGTHRRLFFAFAAGLAKGDSSAFHKNEVMLGVQAFFSDVFEDLCQEVPRLPNIVEAELIPTLRAVFPAEVINLSLPARFRVP